MPLGELLPTAEQAAKALAGETVTTEDKVAEAVMAVAKALPVFVKDTKGQAGGGTYKYFTLDQIMHKLRPVLFVHGFILSHTTEYDGPGCYSFVTQLWHGGEVVREARCPFTPHLDPQKLGSQATYYRRYTTCMLFSIVADKDDDAAAAMEPAESEEVNPACAIDQLSQVDGVSDLSTEVRKLLRAEIFQVAHEHGMSQDQVIKLMLVVAPTKSMLSQLTSGEVSSLLVEIEDRGRGS